MSLVADGEGVLPVMSQLALIAFPILVSLIGFGAKRMYALISKMEEKVSTIDKTTAVMQVELKHVSSGMVADRVKFTELERLVRDRHP